MVYHVAVMLKVNEIAPEFSLPDQAGIVHTLSNYKGKWLVIYFYPKDNTSGCTKEACGISEVYDEFNQFGVVVIGVSKDSVGSHKKFQEKYNLPFTLLSDEATEMIQAYGAWVEKSMYGRKYMGIARVTYIINPAGRIVKVYDKVNPQEHALELLADLKELL